MATLPFTGIDTIVTTFSFTAGTDNAAVDRDLDPFPSDFSHMDTLSLLTRYWQVNWSNDTLGLEVRILDSILVGVLAAATSAGAFQSINTNVTNTSASPMDTSIDFAYVDTAADLATWNGARIQYRQKYTVSMGSDNANIVVRQVDTTGLTGTYTISGPPPVSRPMLKRFNFGALLQL